MTDKEKFIESLPRVGIAVESITAALELYTPCILEAASQLEDILENHGDVFTPEERQRIENINTKSEKCVALMRKLSR